MRKNKSVKVALVGMAMGIAETIPGVSGGTIAFIGKIYQELIDTIKSIQPTNLTKLFKGDLTGFFNAINGKFLSFLMVGMGLGIVIGVFGIDHLLNNYPKQLWAFFFGLVLASAAYLAREVNWDWKTIVLFLIGAVVSFLITRFSPVTGSDNLLFVALCGVVAISALMLPGISGSFILLLLGMYGTVIGSVKSFLTSPGFGSEFKIISAFAVGCLIGLFTFSRVLSYTFKYYFNATMAIMIGVLIGSLNKLWPWRIPVQIMDKETLEIKNWSPEMNLPNDEIKILSEKNLLPSDFNPYGDPNLLICSLTLVLGIGLIFLIMSSDKKA